jgi:hypothetical protein
VQQEQQQQQQDQDHTSAGGDSASKGGRDIIDLCSSSEDEPEQLAGSTSLAGSSPSAAAKAAPRPAQPGEASGGAAPAEAGAGLLQQPAQMGRPDSAAAEGAGPSNVQQQQRRLRRQRLDQPQQQQGPGAITVVSPGGPPTATGVAACPSYAQLPPLPSRWVTRYAERKGSRVLQRVDLGAYRPGDALCALEGKQERGCSDHLYDVDCDPAVVALAAGQVGVGSRGVGGLGGWVGRGAVQQLLCSSWNVACGLQAEGGRVGRGRGAETSCMQDGGLHHTATASAWHVTEGCLGSTRQPQQRAVVLLQTHPYHHVGGVMAPPASTTRTPDRQLTDCCLPLLPAAAACCSCLRR